MTTTNQIEPFYVVDTMTLIWYLRGNKKLSRRAKSIFEAAQRGETELLISAMTLAEMFFANRKWGLFDDFAETYAELKAEPYFLFIPFQPEDVADFEKDKAVPEMHDRIIAGLARRLGMPLITSDPLIVAAKIARIVW